MRLASAADGKNTGDRTEVGLFIPLPAELAKDCPSLAPEDLSSPHVTFLYVGAVPEEREDEFLALVQGVFSPVSGKVRGSLGKTDYFVHPAYDRTIAHMRVRFDQDMREYRRRLREALTEAQFDVQDKFPLHYHPHTTLAYLDGTDQVYDGPRPHGGWSFDSIEVWGMPQVHTVRFGVDPQRVASAHRVGSAYALTREFKDWLLSGPLPRRIVAKYKSKTKDDEGNVHYEYGPRQVAERHKEKAKKVEKLRKSMGDLRKAVLADLKSKDETTRKTALVVALIDATYERVGNEDSAGDGHFGVTGWQSRHLKITGGKATFSYVGKSGVKQNKTVDDERILSALRDVSEGKSGEDPLFDLTSKEVNDYLSKFNVTAKDLRGYHANREMVEKLKELRKKGPKLPTARKEKDEILKGEFDKALEETAKIVGHESSTLRSDYLVPGLEDGYLHDGSVLEKFQKEATKSHREKEDEESDRLVRPSPKKKPPRKDKRRNRVDVDDDPDTDIGDRGDDPDMSLNYKRVGNEKKRQSFPYNGPLIGERVGRGEGVPPLFAQDAETWRENMPRKMTKKGAQQVVAELDRVATVMQNHWEDLGLPEKAAHDLAYRCDLLSDFIEKRAGIQNPSKQAGDPEGQSVKNNPGFDPTEIGEEESGALVADKDEKFTQDNFQQIENRELREKQQGNKLPAADKTPVTSYEGGKQASHGFDLFA